MCWKPETGDVSVNTADSFGSIATADGFHCQRYFQQFEMVWTHKLTIISLTHG